MESNTLANEPNNAMIADRYVCVSARLPPQLISNRHSLHHAVICIYLHRGSQPVLHGNMLCSEGARSFMAGACVLWMCKWSDFMINDVKCLLIIFHLLHSVGPIYYIFHSSHSLNLNQTYYTVHYARSPSHLRSIRFHRPKKICSQHHSSWSSGSKIVSDHQLYTIRDSK